MEEKQTRYIRTVFTLDQIKRATGITDWKDNFNEFLQNYEKLYGLKMISTKEEILIQIEYTNIKWDYKIFYGSYKKKYKQLLEEDERWTEIEKQIAIDLKMMGLEELKEEVLSHLKNNEYYEYKTKKDIQFKQYCV